MITLYRRNSSSRLRRRLRTVVNEQFKAYGEIYEALKEHNRKKYAVLAQDRASHPKIDGWAKEDARYVISLAARTQLGMTLNARNLELMVRRLKASSLGR
jgi:thymidylate synthase ThyX